MGDPIDINVEVLREISVAFLKSVVLQLFPKYRQSYANLNLKIRTKFNRLYTVDGLFWCFPFNC